jgi:hypothetical protein
LDRRVIVVALCWLAISIAAFRSPVLMLFGWPMTGLMLLWALLGGGDNLHAAMPLREPLVLRPRLAMILRALLAMIVGSAVLGLAASIKPSMELHTANGLVYRFGLSIIFAPLLWMIVLATAVRALRIPSPRRLALAAITTLIAWPFLLGIRAANEPWLDFDHRVRVLAPHVIQTYVAAAVAVSGAAIALAFITARVVAGSVVVVPPRAALLRPR